jgi:hypothetical protein
MREKFVELWMSQVGIDEENAFPLADRSTGKARGNACAAFGAFGGCHSKRDAAWHSARYFIVKLVVCGGNGSDAMACRCDVCQHSELEVTFYLRCIFCPPGSKAEIKHSLISMATSQEVCHIRLSV